MLFLLLLFQDISGVWNLVPQGDQKEETLYFFPDGRLLISSPDSYHELTYRLDGKTLTFVIDEGNEIVREIKLEPDSLTVINQDGQVQYLRSNMPLPMDNALNREANLGPLMVSVPQGWKSVESNSEKGQTLILANEQKATQIITTLVKTEEGVSLEEVRNELMDQFVKQLPDTQIKSKLQLDQMYGFSVPCLRVDGTWRENAINIQGAIVERGNHTLVIMVNAFEDMASQEDIEYVLGSIHIENKPALK